MRFALVITRDASGIYELCDRYGLYMIAENNLESHGSWDAASHGLVPKDTIVPGDNMDWEPMMLDRVNSCYQRDKNHPAILIWSVGNDPTVERSFLTCPKNSVH